MKKKLWACVLCLVLLFSWSVSAVETPADGGMPQGGRPQREMPFGGQGQRPNWDGERMQMPEGFTPPEGFEMPEGMTPPWGEAGQRPMQREEAPQKEQATQQPPAEQAPQTEKTEQPQEGEVQQEPNQEPSKRGEGMMQRPGMMQGEGATPPATQEETKSVDYLTLSISLVLLAGAFVFVIFYKRKSY